MAFGKVLRRGASRLASRLRDALRRRRQSGARRKEQPGVTLPPHAPGSPGRRRAMGKEPWTQKERPPQKERRKPPPWRSAPADVPVEARRHGVATASPPRRKPEFPSSALIASARKVKARIPPTNGDTGGKHRGRGKPQLPLPVSNGTRPKPKRRGGR